MERCAGGPTRAATAPRATPNRSNRPRCASDRGGVAWLLPGTACWPSIREGECTMTGTESGEVTGTKDKDYNLIWFTEACLSNALRLETYIQDAERDGD